MTYLLLGTAVFAKNIILSIYCMWVVYLVVVDVVERENSDVKLYTHTYIHSIFPHQTREYIILFGIMLLCQNKEEFIFSCLYFFFVCVANRRECDNKFSLSVYQFLYVYILDLFSLKLCDKFMWSMVWVWVEVWFLLKYPNWIY